MNQAGYAVSQTDECTVRHDGLNGTLYYIASLELLSQSLLSLSSLLLSQLLAGQNQTLLSLLASDNLNLDLLAYEVLQLLNITIGQLGSRNETTDALNESRKTLYKAVIYLEEIVTNLIDAPQSEYEEAIARIGDMPLERRFFIVRKLGLAIRMLMDAYGENTKWKWAFVELNGRFAVVAKNMMDIKETSRIFFDPSQPAYDVAFHYIQLVRKLIAQSVDQYHQRYEFSTHRMDDMQKALLYIAAQRRFCIIFDEKDEAEELKKKGRVFKEKMELDKKKGIAQ